MVKLQQLLLAVVFGICPTCNTIGRTIRFVTGRMLVIEYVGFRRPPAATTSIHNPRCRVMLVSELRRVHPVSPRLRTPPKGDPGVLRSGFLRPRST